MDWQRRYRRMLFTLLALVLVAFSTVVVDHSVMHALHDAEQSKHQIYVLNNMMRRSSDELTRLARSYVVTSDPRYLDLFWQVKAIRDGSVPLPPNYDWAYWDLFLADRQPAVSADDARPQSLLQRADALGLDARSRDLLAQARVLSDQLIEANEVAAFALLERAAEDRTALSGEHHQQAVELLFGEDYLRKKSQIMERVNALFQLTEDRASEHVVYMEDHHDSVRAAMNGALLLVLIGIAYILFSMRRDASAMALTIAEGERRIEAQALDLAASERAFNSMRDDTTRDRMAIVGVLVNSVSHELRNPLATVRSSIEVIRKLDTADGLDVRRRSIERIDRALKRCDKLLDDLFIYNKRSHGPLQQTDVQAWLAQEVGPELRELLPPEQIDIACDTPLELAFDRDELLRAVLNLAENAVQAGGQQVKLRLGLEVGEDTVELRFEDDGPGALGTDLEQMFEPLFSTKANGMGLGLAIVSGIVARHRGQISAGPSAMGGLRVSLFLPRAPAPVADAVGSGQTALNEVAAPGRAL